MTANLCSYTSFSCHFKPLLLDVAAKARFCDAQNPAEWHNRGAALFCADRLQASEEFRANGVTGRDGMEGPQNSTGYFLRCFRFCSESRVVLEISY